MSRRLSVEPRSTPIVIIALALLACSDSNGPAGRSVSLSFATPGPVIALAAAQPSRAALDLSVGDGTHTLVLTSADLVLREVELQAPLTAECTAEPGDDSPECAELDIGPILVSLPLTPGTTSTSMTVAVPAGTYHEIEFRLREPDDDARGIAFMADHPAFANIALRVAGTYDGEPFEFTSRLDATLELEFGTPIVIDAGNNNITVNVDLAAWFMNAGTLIDPRTATGGSASRTAIEQNIQNSFAAFEDDDRDGHDDHGGHGSADSL